ncbi:Toluene 1,2-dioxygenase system ferredoxin subunit [compost metagenome]
MIAVHGAERFVDVVGLAALPPGSQHVHQVGLTRVLLCHTDEGRLFAVLDLCPHARQPLAGGALNGSSITCPKHGARFDLESGCPLNGVSKKSLHTLAVRINGERIEVCLP